MKPGTDHPHLGKLIASIIEEKNMTKAGFGKRICTSRQNVALILKKEHFDTLLLWKISQALKTNLFEDLATAFNTFHPEYGTPSQNGILEIRLKIADTKLVQLTADLVRRIVYPEE
jgi:transcriptional regulator with XRE-family HTH domain